MSKPEAAPKPKWGAQIAAATGRKFDLPQDGAPETGASAPAGGTPAGASPAPAAPAAETPPAAPPVAPAAQPAASAPPAAAPQAEASAAPAAPAAQAPAAEGAAAPAAAPAAPEAAAPAGGGSPKARVGRGASAGARSGRGKEEAARDQLASVLNNVPEGTIPEGMTQEDVIKALLDAARKKAAEAAKARVSVTLPADLDAEVRERAKEENRSVNSLIIRACRRYLKLEIDRVPRGQRRKNIDYDPDELDD